MSFKCPRRGEVPPMPGLPQDDHWRENGTCSFCGSMEPGKFLALAVLDGAEVIPTDKNYKAYIRAPGVDGKFYYQHFTDEQKTEFIDLVNAKKIKIGIPGYFYVLPFFVTVTGQ